MANILIGEMDSYKKISNIFTTRNIITAKVFNHTLCLLLLIEGKIVATDDVDSEVIQMNILRGFFFLKNVKFYSYQKHLYNSCNLFGKQKWSKIAAELEIS